jgi:SAM-dependent methyltransferase
MKENRQKIYDEYAGEKNKILARTMTVYDRYFEANLIINELKRQNIDFATLSVLDYGCACGDYGISLARNGAAVGFIDIVPANVAFAEYRLDRENLKKIIEVPNFVIFGEVLEHLDHPLEVLKQYKCKYLFTSSYPFRTDDPNDKYWDGAFRGSGLPGDHTKTAFEEQPACREYLEECYNAVRWTEGGGATLWMAK